MDKSVDSIGSCSLDVDADSSEKSDTSGSLNFPTPISIKDITRDFVANINERCPIRKVDTTATLMNSSPKSSSQTETISTQPTCTLAPTRASALQSIATEEDIGNDKKPSYLNLACCVNGYSNITTYDSKIRQDINKSREVSPIRPSTSSIQYCKKNDYLAPPKLQKMPNASPIDAKHELKTTSTTTTLTQRYENGNGHHVSSSVGANESKSTSFIQQQMERLYGPAALAQGFYSPKKTQTATSKQRVDNGATSELKLKFKELSPSKDYSEFRRKLNGSATQTLRTTMEINPDNNNIDLPVLRHLSQEFRAQLPKISPKRNLLRSPPSEDENASLSNNITIGDKRIHKVVNETLVLADEVDHKSLAAANDTNLIEAVSSLSVTKRVDKPTPTTETVQPAKGQDFLIIESSNHQQEKDGHHFIKILKAEGTRLLSLAAVAEQYIEELSDQPDVGEEVLGLLRSASGKARLLVTQKMKQFEGLCMKNINDKPGEACPTTADDLQGFWDMVYLQVDDINAIFTEVNKLKQNNWKLDLTTQPQMTPKRQTKPSNVSAANGSSNKAPKAQKSAAVLERESQRKQKILEMKRQKKMELAAAAANAGSMEQPANMSAAAEKPFDILINENKS